MAVRFVRRNAQIEGRTGGKTCSFWQKGRCNRNPCRFLHGEAPMLHNAYGNANNSYRHGKRPHSSSENTLKNKSKAVLARKSADRGTETCVVQASKKSSPSICKYWINSNCVHGESCRNLHSWFNGDGFSMLTKFQEHKKSKAVLARKSADRGTETCIVQASKKSSPSICKYWINSNCVHGESCRNLHSWFNGDGFSMLTKFQEHKKVITGIALPVGSDKLYTGSTDGTVRIWDCHTGQCVRVINLGAEVTSLISKGPWIFVGIPNAVKAWNIQTGLEFTLDGPKGRVLAMTVGNNTLFAAAEDGVISAWRGSFVDESPFELVASLTGHTKSVVCLTVGCNMLYSGSMDQSIKAWDMDTLQCKMTLNAHTDVVTSLICWDHYLLSSSSDCTIKIWAATEEGPLKVIYTHNEENGVISLFGMPDAEGKPVLFCSCKDNSVRMYELPSFSERGRLYAMKDVASIEAGPDGLFFTGDRTGLLTVWKWLEEPKVACS